MRQILLWISVPTASPSGKSNSLAAAKSRRTFYLDEFNFSGI
jgi:hypothetical protein